MKHFIGYKKSILISIGFLFFTSLLNAQEPTAARRFFYNKDFASAKQSIDSFVQINSTNAMGWMLKAEIYNQIAKEDSLNSMVADGRMDAFLALQKAMQVNAVDINEELKAGNYHLPFDLYDGFTNDGLVYYNAGIERNDNTMFNEALNRFKKAGLVSQFIYSNKWGLTAMDTNNLFFSAKAAINTGREEDALLFAKKIADSEITHCQAGTAFESIYQWLVFYYKKQNDGNNLVKYMQLAMNKFPLSVYFDLIMVDWQRQQQDYPKLFAAYQQLFIKQPGNSLYLMAYCKDMFNYLFNSKAEITCRPVYEDKLEQGLLQYLKANPTSAEARLLMAKLYTNQANEQVREAAKRSTTNLKVINGYTITRINLLKKANHYLNDLVTYFCQPDIKTCSEARKLRKENLQIISLMLRPGVAK